jgi:hypothetical protein
VKHFSDELWADFVRNLAPATTAQAMQKHIEDGCSKCEAVLKSWQSVFRIAQEEGGSDSEGAVCRGCRRTAKPSSSAGI